MLGRPWRLGLGLCLLGAAPLSAQLAPVGVPRGLVRIELGGSLGGFDRLFDDGTLANLGEPEAQAQVSRGVGIAGLGLGLTERISIAVRGTFLQNRIKELGPVDPAEGSPIKGGVITRGGDAEAALTLTPIDGWHRTGGALRTRFAVEALLRVPTQKPDSIETLLDGSSDEGQTDYQATAVLDVARGALGFRTTAFYVVQRSSTVARWLVAPGEVVTPTTERARLNVTPGNVFGGSLQPFLRLAPNFALIFGADYRQRNPDEAEYASAGDVVAGIDADVVARQTETATITLSGGITYANMGARRAGGSGLPLEASWRYETVVGGNTGRVPQRRSIRAELRMYTRVW